MKIAKTHVESERCFADARRGALHHAHVLPNNTQLPYLHKRGLVATKRLDSPDNAITLCPACHAAWDREECGQSRPDLAIYPAHVEFFLRKEEEDFAARKKVFDINKTEWSTLVKELPGLEARLVGEKDAKNEKNWKPKSKRRRRISRGRPFPKENALRWTGIASIANPCKKMSSTESTNASPWIHTLYGHLLVVPPRMARGEAVRSARRHPHGVETRWQSSDGYIMPWLIFAYRQKCRPRI